MAVEIERKFRLERQPDWLGDCEATRIEQGYLAIEGGGGAEVRLRRRDGETLLTVKRGVGARRIEEEIALEPEQFEALWPLTDGRRVEKVRYLVPIDTGEVEVDVFEGELAGMITAEMEFDSEAQATRSIRPRGSAGRSPATTATRTKRSRSTASRWKVSAECLR